MYIFEKILYGILLYSKILLYENTLKFVEKLKGEKLRGPPKLIFFIFFI